MGNAKSKFFNWKSLAVTVVGIWVAIAIITSIREQASTVPPQWLQSEFVKASDWINRFINTEKKLPMQSDFERFKLSASLSQAVTFHQSDDLKYFLAGWDGERMWKYEPQMQKYSRIEQEIRSK